MRLKISSFSCAGLLVLSAASATHADQRFKLRCLVNGEPTNVMADNSINTPAMAQYLKGQRTIRVSPKLTEDLPAVVQIFIVAHECGHLIASPTLDAAYHERIDPDRERVADRIGIRLL